MLIMRCTKKCVLYHKSDLRCNSEVKYMKQNLTLAKCLWFKLLYSHKVNFFVKHGAQEMFHTDIQKNPAALSHPNGKETAEHHWIKTT